MTPRPFSLIMFLLCFAGYYILKLCLFSGKSCFNSGDVVRVSCLKLCEEGVLLCIDGGFDLFCLFGKLLFYVVIKKSFFQLAKLCLGFGKCAAAVSREAFI